MTARSNEVWNFSHTSFTNEIANYVFILENKVFQIEMRSENDFQAPEHN